MWSPGTAELSAADISTRRTAVIFRGKGAVRLRTQENLILFTSRSRPGWKMCGSGSKVWRIFAWVRTRALKIFGKVVASSSTIASIYLFVPLLPPYSGIIYIKALARQAQVNLSSDIIQIWFIYLFYLMSSILWADRQEPCRAAIYSDDTQPHNNIKEEVCAGAVVKVF